VSREIEPALPYSGMSGQIAHYRLGGYIGRGAMGVVYLAQDQRTGSNVALKVVAPELAGDAAFRARFVHESRMAASLSHPHIIPVYEADEAGGSLYVAMRYVQGGDARSLLNRHGPLPAAWAWNIIAGVASALDAAHAHGLIHGDVRPANMLLDTGGQENGAAQEAAGNEPGHVYLSDFGMGRSSATGAVIAAGQVEPLDYAAPEQIEKHEIDGRADLYSLACAGFELLCGTPPFGQDQGLTLMYAQLYAPPPSASARRPDLPQAVDAVLATALAKNPADRFASCGHFAQALHAALGGAPGAAGVPGGQVAMAGPAAPVPDTWPGGYVQPGPAADAAQAYQQPEPPQAYQQPDATQAYQQPDATQAYQQPDAAQAYQQPDAAQAYQQPDAAPGYPQTDAPHAQPDAPQAYPQPGAMPAYPQTDAPQAYQQPDATQQYPQTDAPLGYPQTDAPQAYPQPGTAPGYQQTGATQAYLQPDATQAYQQPGAPQGYQQTGAPQGYPQPGAGPGQLPLDATLAEAPGMYGGGWKGPPQPPQAAQARPGADFITRLRGAYPQSGSLPTGRKLMFSVAALAVVIVGIVVGLVLSGGSSPSTPAASSHAASPGPSASAASLATRQAAAVSSLLSTSEASRRSLEGAVADVRNCSDLPAATSQIQAVVSERSAEYRRVSALSMAALANGAVVKSDLLTALRASLNADRDYLTWARQQRRAGCSPAGRSGAYNAAVSADGQAGSAKAAFVQVWNPVAAKYGDPQESQSDI
jgi:hypothetical protein